ncbi:MAG: hypothetical protein MJY69_06235 [Bacteroidales bacterium]|nr:hypothetical protein [Bacteroidales bacterium]
MKKIFLFVSLLLAQATGSAIELKTVQKFPLTQQPELHSTNGLVSYYSHGGRVMNFVNIERGKVNGTIQDIKILPTGTSFYALYSNRKRTPSLITDNLSGKAVISKLNETHPSCFCFSADASMILTAGNDGNIHVFSILNNKFKEIKTLEEHAVCSSMAISHNKYYVVTSSGNELHIFNYDTAQLRFSRHLDGKVKEIRFTSDDAAMYVLCDNSTIHSFETVNFSEIQKIGNLGEAISFDVTRDGKYIAVASSDHQITVINSFNQSQRQSLEIPEGGISGISFAKLRNGSERLAYNTKESLVFSELTGLEANYTKLLQEELNYRMNTWMKQMPNESLEEYNLRVNDSSIKAQSVLFQQEIATRLANQYFNLPECELEGYDYSNHILPISLGDMQQIYLTVPQEDLMSFSSSDFLEFRAPVYIVNEADEFELVYVEVFNKQTGKQYVFDNRERRALDFLSLNENYVPLELIQLSSMQENKLKDIKESVIEESMNKSIISSHTKVNVQTNIASDTDADGKKIIIFSVSMDYVVDREYSEKEDYPSGHYRVEESGAATALCNIISKAFTDEFGKYIKEGKKVTVSVNGAADASAIRNALSYDGCYGDFFEYPAYDNGVLCEVTVDSKKGIKTNDELAFIRAAGLKEEICKRIEGLDKMNSSFIYNIHVSDSVGSEHRRVSVSFSFPDAF